MYHNITALVLNARVSAEADKSLMLYTRQWGKITVIAPGAKKITAKLAGATEPVMESQFMVYARHTTIRAKITGAKINESFPVLRTDWRRMAVAQCCGEVVAALSPYNAENDQKYDLLLRTWRLLETAQHPVRIFAAFALRFLKLSGYSFIEFIKHEGVGLSARETEAIHQCATLSGEMVDTAIELDAHTERRMIMHIMNYLCTHTGYPLHARAFMRTLLDTSEMSCVA